MLELVSLLYPYLVVLYLADCLFYVGKQEVAFSSTFGGSFRKLNTGLHLAGFLPGDRLFITGKTPFGLTASGLYHSLDKSGQRGNRHRPENYAFSPFAGIEALSTDGNTLKLNESVSIRTRSPQEAVLWAARLSEIGALAFSDRMAAIVNGIRTDTDLNEVRKAYDRWSLIAEPINLMSALMFACFFTVLPLGLYLIPVAASLMVGLIIFMLFIYGFLCAATWRRYKHLYPKDISGLYKIMATLLFSPVSVMHISVHLTRNLLTTFDFMAVSALLLRRELFINMMHREIHLIETTRKYSDKFGWEDYWRMRSTAMHALIKEAALTIEDVFAQPQKNEPAAVAYCPVCLTEYRDGYTLCSDCALPLKAY